MPVLANARHERFAQGLAKGLPASAAYVNAGFREHDGNASRLSGNERIIARVGELQAVGQVRAEISVEKVLRELSRLGLSDVRRLFTDAGSLKHPTEWDDDTAASVASIEVVTKTLRRNRDGQPDDVEYVHKIKLWDKNSALEKLAKHLGMFIERVEHSGPGGGPIKTEEVSARDVIASRLAGLAARSGPEGGS